MDQDLSVKLDTLGRRFTEALNRQSPAGGFEFKLITFGASGTDLTITHKLPINDPNQICYIPIQLGAAAHIYQDTSANRRPWSKGVIYLRSDVSNLKALLMLFYPAPGADTVS